MRKVFLRTGLVLLSLSFVFLTFNPAAALDVKVSGQINQMVMWADDGTDDDFFVADNDNSSTRMRLTGEEAFGTIKAGFQFEIEAQRNASNTVTINQTDEKAFEWNDRWFNVYFDTAFGKFEIGKGDAAANNTTEVDLSGTAVINYSDITATGGSLVWRNSDGSLYSPGSTSTVEVVGGAPAVVITPVGRTISNTRTNMDGALSRSERIRYNTPVFAGFMLAASASNGGAWDGSLWYSGDFAGNKLTAAIGYTKLEDRSATIDDQWGGSISWLAPFGLNVTLAYGERNLDTPGREDPKNWYAKVGYRRGIHAFSIEYGETTDLRVNDEDCSNYGVAYVVNPWKPVEFYATYRQYWLDAPGGAADPEDIQVAGIGTRVRF